MNIHQFPSYLDAMRDMRVAPRDASRATGSDERAERFGAAMRLMEGGHWRQAFRRLAELAGVGHPQSARIALLLAQRGTLLLGGSFRASARQRESWQRASD